MAGVAAGGFLARAFESMLKECGNKKYSDLQSAIQTYFDYCKDADHPVSYDVKDGSEKPESSAEKGKNGDNHLNGAPSSPEEDPASGIANKIEPINKVLANAGYTLGGSLVEIVLNPLRVAFETKNIKFVELALDCLHKLIEYNHLDGDPGLNTGTNSKLLADILNMVCSLVGSSTPDSTTLQVLKVLFTAIASSKMRVHGDPLLGVIRVCFDVALNSKNPINQATSKAMLTQMLSIVLRHLETDGVPADSLEAKEMDSTDTMTASENLIYVQQKNMTYLSSFEGIQSLVGANDIKGVEAIFKQALSPEGRRMATSAMDPHSMNAKLSDALLVLQTLCEMGMKEGNDDATTKTRVLVLELLQSSLEGVSSQKIFQFLDSVRGHLSLVLMRASVSESSILFQSAVGILSVILLRLRESFKDEIGILCSVIVLRFLDGSDLNKKLIILRMMERVCKDPQLLVELYINYDCDPEAQNLFEKMVIALSRISQGTQNMDSKSSAASLSKSVKTSSLQALVNVLKSLGIWEKSHRGQGNQGTVESVEEFSSGKRDDDPNSGKDLPSNFMKSGDNDSITGTAISEFNQNSVKGIQYMMSSQLVDNNLSSVAQFLRNTPGLDKAMIGDYLGQNEEFATATLHAYVESMNFSGMKLHIAIYEFLESIQLPWDAQKVDRIIEKFSECYYKGNPGLFMNADAVYVLAYAIIMLAADCENSQKLSKSEFVHLSLRNEESAPTEILEDMYDAIVERKLNLTVDHARNSKDSKRGLMQILKNLNLSLPKTKYFNGSKFHVEEIIKKIQNFMKGQGTQMGVFYTSQRIELMYPIVEAVGWPLLATFSVTMGEADNDSRINLCMEGFKEGVHLTHSLEIDTMRYAFMTSLLRYNFLHAPKEMRDKNVEALRALLDLCDTAIYTLHESWLAILECISRLEYVVSWPPITATVMQGSNHLLRDVILQNLRQLSGKPTDQVFINSIKLPSEEAVEFFTALCCVSAEELKQTPARTFSLQKIVEISYDNMGRIHLVWSRIWSVVSMHFVFAGEHADERVAMYAVDSLRQLIIKYLDRLELPNFSFQNDILNPIAVLMERSKSDALRRLLLNSIIQIIKSRGGRMKSGWQSVFMIFTASANNDMEQIVERAFENLEQVMLEHFNQVFKDFFMDCVNCLIGFAKNKCSQNISLKAIALLRICEDRLAEGLTSNTSDHAYAEKYWYAMLNGLSHLTSDRRPEIRDCALEVLFDLLDQRGNQFSKLFWETIFQQVLFPIFSNIIKAGRQDFVSSSSDLTRESSAHALQLLCNLFNSFYKDVSHMLPQLLSLLFDCAKKNDQLVISISFGALVHLIEVGGYQFSDPDWDALLKSTRDVSYTTQPLELLNDPGFEKGKYLPRDSSPALIVASVDLHGADHNQETMSHGDAERTNGILSSPGAAGNPSKTASLQSSQSFGQKIMENMKENLLMRGVTSRRKALEFDEVTPSSPTRAGDHTAVPDVDTRGTKEGLGLDIVRSKCITQLLLLGVVDCIQSKYWSKLNAQQKVSLMEILYSVLEFAASYNSCSNLRLRMHQIPTERSPSNLFRQELSGTSIYLDILQKTTAAVNEEQAVKEKLDCVAEAKLVSFCEEVLREASDFQASLDETTNMEIHRVAELRSPITVKVLKSMSGMNPHIFKSHLNAFFPSITKLIRCDQIEVRDALADLLSMQLTGLLP